MSELKLCLLGSPHLEQDNAPLPLKRRKAIALLVYLAVTKETHTRESLATLLWPDYDASKGRAYLRRELAAINKAVGTGWLIADREQIGLNLNAPLWLDVDQFQRGAQIEADESQSINVTTLIEAVALYRGDFLAGFTLADAPDFDEWQFFQVESLRQRLGYALERLIDLLSQQGEFEQAIPHARQRLSLDPLHEPAHRSLIWIYHQAGQHSAAIRQYESCVQILDDELGVPLETETVTLYEAIKAHRFVAPLLPSDDNEAKAVKASKQQITNPEPRQSERQPTLLPPGGHSLPIQSTPFIGRETELTDVTTRLSDPTVRLLTILGPGGMGKTRLAIEAARQNTSAFGDGVYFVSLAQVDEANFQESLAPLVATLADTFHLTFQGHTPPTEQLLAYLTDKTILLVLDNFEHLLSQATIVSAMLQRTRQVKILTTSRERLNLREEWLFSLAGLPVLGDDAPSADGRQYSAIQLFQQTAQQVQPDFNLSAELSDVIRICTLLSGMPLGIELAAAWVRMLSCQTIAQEIEKSIDFLETNARDIPKRHRNLRAVFEHSWQLLSEKEQAVLSKISIFRGGFQREAALTVADASLPLLASLVDKSMIRKVGLARFTLHELLRQFALDKLQGNQDTYDQIRQFHSQYYLSFLAERTKDLKSGRQRAAVDEISADLDNIRLAWRYAIANGQIASLMNAVECFWTFSDTRGMFLEGANLFENTMTALISTSDRTTENCLTAQQTSLNALLLAGQGALLGRGPNTAAGRKLLEQSLSIWQQQHPPNTYYLGLTHFWLGVILYNNHHSKK